jgi:hypothetical protein
VRGGPDPIRCEPAFAELAHRTASRRLPGFDELVDQDDEDDDGDIVVK